MSNFEKLIYETLAKDVPDSYSKYDNDQDLEFFKEVELYRNQLNIEDFRHENYGE